MKTYKVIALSVGALGNKIFHSGDVVKESDFKEGRADELVKLDFLELITETTEGAGIPTPVTIPKPDENKAGDVVKESDKVDDIKVTADNIINTDNVTSYPPIEKTDIKIMIQDLANAKIDFDKNSSKQEIYNSWIKLFDEKK